MPNRRPQLRIEAPAASPEEAAAVVAALERFMRETAPTAAPAPPPVSGWVRAARAEAVERDPGLGPWS
jgi:hypothetical protein